MLAVQLAPSGPGREMADAHEHVKPDPATDFGGLGHGGNGRKAEARLRSAVD